MAAAAHVEAIPALAPMLASIGDEVPENSHWAFEPKYDGVRVLAFVTAGAVALITRNGHDKAAQFPEIVEALRELRGRRRRPFVLDGEIVARMGRSHARFQALQHRIGEQNPEIIAEYVREIPAVLVAFDLLLDGQQSLVNEPWTERRRHLERLLRGKVPRGLRLGRTRVGHGRQLLERARELGWEGLIAKRTDATYLPGRRTRDWLKLKVVQRQEFVVGGWTEPRRTRPFLGALILGVWDDDRLVYVGHMGGGFTRQALEEMRERLEPLEQPASPFEVPPPANEAVHWVRPEVIVEVEFSEWTHDGRLRQPIFVGVRTDKDPRTIVREPESVQATDRSLRERRARIDGGARDGQARGQGRGFSEERIMMARRNGATKSRLTMAGGRRIVDDIGRIFDQLADIEEQGGDGTVDLDRNASLRVTSLDKIYFPDAQRTKGDVMRYYVRAAPWLLPLMADRPLILKRHPEGVDGESFFQHDPPDNAPPAVRIEVVTTAEGERAPRLIGGDLVTLLYGVQIGAIAVNPWHSRVTSPQYPDYLVLDLDPGSRTPFRTVVQVARWLKDELDDAGLVGGVKTSGSRGLHILVPLPHDTSDESAVLMGKLFARRVSAAHRREATTTRSRSTRSQRAVYIDYLQNAMGKSVVAAFSVRARAGAMVSTPLAWEELTDDLDPTVFTIDTVPDELEPRGALWRAAMQHRNRLERLLASA